MGRIHDPLPLIAQADIAFLMARLLEPPDKQLPGGWPADDELEEFSGDAGEDR